MKQARLIPRKGSYICSECGVEFSKHERHLYFTPELFPHYIINCKKCGTVFEKPEKEIKAEFRQLSFFTMEDRQ